MSLSIGIVGLPNVGKSTLLNALTSAAAEASNYPFCTIEKNVGVTPVPDPHLLQLDELLSPEEAQPTTVQFVDIAGLVEGASKGDGLGNQFLGHIRDVDAILHVVRCFADDNIAHTPGAPDPVRDIQIVETELLLADLETAQRQLDKWTRLVRTGDKTATAAQDAFTRAVQLIETGSLMRDVLPEVGLTDEQRTVLSESRFLTAKPCLYLANTDEDDPRGQGPLPTALRELKGPECVICASVGIEEEISQLPAEERAEFIADLGLAETALNQVITSCYRLLSLITFYTIAHNKLRAWQLVSGGTAAEAAGKIHTDMERGFIRAQVITLEDLVRLGSWQALQEQGLVRTVGRDYVVEDKDILQVFFQA
jgi:GTP-binding protein YchF